MCSGCAGVDFDVNGAMVQPVQSEHGPRRCTGAVALVALALAQIARARSAAAAHGDPARTARREMKVCFRCRQRALATLSIEAIIAATRLKISGEAEPAGICAACLLTLTDWFKAGDRDPVSVPDRTPTVRDWESRS
jgi:hypothetical protein